MYLGLVGHQRRECPPEPERIAGQVATTAVALVEDQVDDREHGGQAIRQHIVRRHAERDAGGLDLVLRPHQPLGHGRLGHEERARDLGRRQAAERAQGERHLCFHCEGRMAAREHELESLVGKRRLPHPVLHCLRHLEQVRLGGQGPIAPDAIEGAVARGGHEPGARLGRDSVARPALRGDRERLLGGFLGEFEIAEEADQGSEDPAPLIAEDLLEVRYHSSIGRTSTAPPMRAAGMREASAIAASRSSASKWR